MRPPHWRWGNYYWYPRWGWYHTAIVAGATLVYVATLPNRQECVRIEDPDGLLYLCDGVIYRPTYYRDEQVYEIVSPAQQSTATAPATGSAAAPASNDAEGQLQLTSPMMRGDRVRALQSALVATGFDVGGVDGIFGRGTDAAVREFQEWFRLPVTGIVDDATAEALGQAYATTLAPDLANYGTESAEPEPNANPAPTDAETAAPTAEPQQNGNETEQENAVTGEQQSGDGSN